MKNGGYYRFAIVREPGPNCGLGLTTSQLGAPNFGLVQRQHKQYISALQSLGLEIEQLPALEHYPDAWFVEDVAVVTPELAIITRPGAQSRRGEVDHIAESLRKYRELEFITDQGCLDGGDVLIIGQHCIVGLSQRTNLQGVAQLSDSLQKYDYHISTIQLPSGLHLKSSVNFIDAETLLLTEQFKDHPELSSYQKIIVPKHEQYAANIVHVNGSLLVADSFPETAQRLQQLDYNMIILDMSEVEKMDGGLTCMSLRIT